MGYLELGEALDRAIATHAERFNSYPSPRRAASLGLHIFASTGRVMDEQGAPDGLTELSTVLDEFSRSNTGFEVALRQIQEIAAINEWTWLTSLRRQDFFARTGSLLRTWSYAQYCEDRWDQLVEGNFAIWVFRADHDCPDEHQVFDALCLPPEHSFWPAHRPPIDWDCGCYIAGASSERAALRLGGIPDKPLQSPSACSDTIWAQRPLDLGCIISALSTLDAPA